MYKNIKFNMLLLLIALVSTPAIAAEDLNMEGMSVIGNKESPNLIYIVRWKSPEILNLEDPLISARIFNDALEPVNRETLIRKELYRQAKRTLHNR